MILTADEIRDILPHRYPFLLIDRVTDYTPGAFARAVKCVSANEPFFPGHFPGKSIMPGVLIVEAIAQTGGIALMTDERYAGKLVVLASIKNARFIKPVTPGDTLEIHCKITRVMGSVGFGAGEVFVSGEVVCSAELVFGIIEFTI